MPLTAYVPVDPERYRRREDSVLFSPQLAAGAYVFVQDCAGKVWVLPDGSHVHPYVLGRARPAVAAGELIVESNGVVVSLNNLSGTFLCHSDSLFTAVGGLVMQGATVAPDAVHPFEV